jgi:pyruvate,orthophosphate dikinase
VKVKSKALEINLADYHVDVDIDVKYAILQEVMSKYYGLMEGLNTFLKELSHPYKNWRFIVTETRKYSLEYFHLIKNHPKGPTAANLLSDMFFDALESDVERDVKVDAIDNLQLFLHKVVKDSGPDLETFLPFINRVFLRIADLPDDHFALFTRSYYQINRLAESFLNVAPKADGVFNDINRLLIKFYKFTYEYWLAESDPQAWFEAEVSEIKPQNDYGKLFKFISHSQLKNWKHRLMQMADTKKQKSDKLLAALLEFPGYSQIVDAYHRIPPSLLKSGNENGRGRHLKLIFLFQIMNIAGLSLIHEETLRDINQTLGWIIENENYRHIQNLIQKTFSILKKRASMYPATALN